MADINRGNRPLSPFMIGPIYRPQINSIMSICHRLTGLGLALTGISGMSLGAAALGLVLGLGLMLPGHALGATGASVTRPAVRTWGDAIDPLHVKCCC